MLTSSIKAVSILANLEAMSLAVPATPGHVNKRPFSGILTRIDEASDGPPGGSGGRLVLVTKACAEKALSTLLGMGIDCRADFNDHKASHKIGVITDANIEGNAIVIAGHFFEKDFPDEMAKIDAQKSRLGFSYELTPTEAAITAENLLRIDDGIFTGAALLYKDKAAYRSTSLAASDTQEPTEMELKELIEAVAKLTAANADTQKLVGDLAKKIEAGTSTAEITGSAECMAAVEPHAAALERTAAAMKASGIGAHPENGHARVLHSMAGTMRAAAAMGRLPHVFRDHDYPMSAAVTAAVDPETKKQLETVQASLKTLTDSLAGITTKIADLKASNERTAAAPERKTLNASTLALLQRHSAMPADGDISKINLDKLGMDLKASGMPPEQIMVVKNTIDRATKGMAA